MTAPGQKPCPTYTGRNQPSHPRSGNHHIASPANDGRASGYTCTMLVRAAPSFTSSADTVSATCRIVVSYDRSSTPIENFDYYAYDSTRISQTTGGFNEQKAVHRAVRGPGDEPQLSSGTLLRWQQGRVLERGPGVITQERGRLRHTRHVTHAMNWCWRGQRPVEALPSRGLRSHRP